MKTTGWIRIGTAVGAITVASWLVATPGALAQVVGLTLNTPTVGNFGAITIDGTPRVTTAAVSGFTVSDVRISPAGWRVTVSATQFCEQLLNAACVALTPKTLPVGSLDQSGPTVSGPGTAPTVSSPTGIDSAPATLASAAASTGTGTYTFSSSTLTLRIPANAYARTYVSTISWTIASGP